MEEDPPLQLGEGGGEAKGGRPEARDAIIGFLSTVSWRSGQG